MSDELKRGLEGVLVAESALSHVDGQEGRLIYRGYPIEDLARGASYEEVLYLLWHGHLPTRSERDEFVEALAADRAIDDRILSVVRELAALDANSMAAIRTAVSYLAATDPDGPDTDPQDAEVTLRKGRRITAKLPTILAAFARLREGKEPIEPRDDLDHATNFLYMLNDEVPDAVLAETFDAALVLHADHGLNASTFSAMVTASTLCDVHGAITSAIGTLSGPLHGGANQNVMYMLEEVDDAEVEPTEWVQNALAEGRRIPGFGHRVYKVKDPRAYILGEMSEELGAAAGDSRWYEYSVAIEEFMAEEKGIPPNVDFYSATTYYQMGIPIDLYTPIFAVSRVGGWVAHVLEQYEDNRIMRPRAKYVGPWEQEFVPIEDR